MQPLKRQPQASRNPSVQRSTSSSKLQISAVAGTAEAILAELPRRGRARHPARGPRKHEYPGDGVANPACERCCRRRVTDITAGRSGPVDETEGNCNCGAGHRRDPKALRCSYGRSGNGAAEAATGSSGPCLTSAQVRIPGVLQVMGPSPAGRVHTSPPTERRQPCRPPS